MKLDAVNGSSARRHLARAQSGRGLGSLANARATRSACVFQSRSAYPVSFAFATKRFSRSLIMPGLLPDVDPDGLLEYSVVFPIARSITCRAFSRA